MSDFFFTARKLDPTFNTANLAIFKLTETQAETYNFEGAKVQNYLALLHLKWKMWKENTSTWYSGMVIVLKSAS